MLSITNNMKNVLDKNPRNVPERLNSKNLCINCCVLSGIA
jgi:hypothetical protein